MKINLKYIEDIEFAVGYNSSSAESYAKRRITELLKVLLKGESIIIEDIGVELKTVEEYKFWKQDREYLNTYNTEYLINEIKKKNK